MNNINNLLDFIAKIVIITLSQLIWLLGLIFIFGLLLYLFARFTRTTYVNSVGSKFDIIVTGWIGTPVHELGHAVFCILFRHQITEMKLYTPNSTDGTLGYVAHSYNYASRFQRIGNFFIGIGPILFGTLALYSLLYYLLPESAKIFLDMQKNNIGTTQFMDASNWHNIWIVFLDSIITIFTTIFHPQNFLNWRFYILIYLSFCIASHMELSPPDIKGALSGLLVFVFTILGLNFIVAIIEAIGIHSFAGRFWQYLKLETYAPHINNFLGTLGALLTYALIISALNFLLSYILLTIYSIIKNKKGINPFKVSY